MVGTGICLSVPAFAVADCLTAQDLTTGISAKVDDGLTEVFRAVGPNIVELTIDFGGGFVGREWLAHGLYIVDSANFQGGMLQDDGWVTVSFPGGVGDLPVPAANTSFDVTVTAEDNLGTFNEFQEYRWGDETTVTYGECQYRVISGTIRSDLDGSWTLEEVQYLPELGLSLQLAFSERADPQGYRRSYLSFAPTEAAGK